MWLLVKKRKLITGSYQLKIQTSHSSALGDSSIVYLLNQISLWTQGNLLFVPYVFQLSITAQPTNQFPTVSRLLLVR
ncbi:hypothetical protein F7734_37395 [Scytonema sp. UIC 10036]|uniref:hypothetical protein n=1 Tax=Scytonema sp. UIC 10036 TaxID=2304196 RepID=UPI0012DA6672|nr:hypothetical protein [Scytonema sp. UIC 10036]MUG97683.1 hypothetical protein [Scytonema sp. UIC 10036]